MSLRNRWPKPLSFVCSSSPWLTSLSLKWRWHRCLRKNLECLSMLGKAKCKCFRYLTTIISPNRYPFSYDDPFRFVLTYIYQMVGISMSACVNCTTDTFVSSTVAHMNAQVRRLGIQLTKVRKYFLTFWELKASLMVFRSVMSKPMSYWDWILYQVNRWLSTRSCIT